MKNPIRAYFANWVSSSEPERKLAEQKYQDLVRAHGELFEDAMVMMTEEDKLETRRRKQRFTRIWAAATGVIFLFVASALIFGIESLGPGNFFQLGGLILAPLLFGWVIISQFNRALKIKKKRVVKGVVTDKQMVNDDEGKVNKRKDDSNGCYIVLSMRYRFQSLPEVYKTLDLGEIIQVEMLSDEIFIKKNVKKLGNI